MQSIIREEYQPVDNGQLPESIWTVIDECFTMEGITFLCKPFPAQQPDCSNSDNKTFIIELKMGYAEDGGMSVKEIKIQEIGRGSN